MSTGMALLRFLTLFFVALALLPAGAHLMELVHKISMPGAEYLTVQKIYRGWTWRRSLSSARCCPPRRWR